MATALSAGAVRDLHSQPQDEQTALATEPTLQVLSVKKVSSAAGTDRYRLIMSDGVHFMQAMLATQLNHMITSDPPALEKNTIVRLIQYACNIVQNRRIVICLGLECVSEPGDKVDKIGTPVSVDGVATPAVVAPDVKPVTRPAAAASSSTAKKPLAGKAKGGPSGGPIYPIEGLSPYQNKWTIKARVTTKSDIRHWSNAKGEGQLFSVNLLDETGEIKATGFGEAVDKLYPELIEGKVYYISKARVNIAKKQFSNLSNEYEIMFEPGTEVTLCEDQESAPQISYNFVPLSNLESIEKDGICDVLGIVKDNGELGEITVKSTSKQLKKRELTVVDSSGYSIRVTLWGKSAENWVEVDNGIYAFKGAKVGDFGGRTLSMGGQSTMAANPDIPEAHALRGWFDAEGQTTSFTSFSSAGGAQSNATFRPNEFRTIAQAKLEFTGEGEKPDYFNVRATVVFIKPESLSYTACPSEKCSKKVTLSEDQTWRCEKCDQSYPAPEHRYLLNLSAADYTDAFWLSGFNDVAFPIIGHTADEMDMLKDEDNSKRAKHLKTATTQMYNFAIKAKADTYNDQVRVRYSIMRAVPISFADAAKQLLAEIKSY